MRISDELFATSHWPLRKVEIGDEIALFTQSTKADSFIVGEIVSIIECKTPTHVALRSSSEPNLERQ